MKRIAEKVLLLSFSLSLLIPAAPGIAICVGGDGHTAIVTTSEDHCCSEENDHNSADAESDHLGHLEPGASCIDIALSSEIKPANQSDNSTRTFLSSFVILRSNFLIHRSGDSITLAASPPTGALAIIDQLSTVVIRS